MNRLVTTCLQTCSNLRVFTRVDESCPWYFIGTVLATGPECIMNIYVILGRRNLFEIDAVRSAHESRSVALVWRLGILVTGALFWAHGKQ